MSRQTHRNRTRMLISGIFLRNPILISGLILAPAIVAAYSLKNAAALSMVMAMVTLPSLLLASVLSRFAPALPEPLRVVCLVVCSGGFLYLAYWTVRGINPTLIDSVGIYGPLLALNSVIFARAKHFPLKKHPLPVLADGLSYSIGFALAISVVGAIRELFGAGTLWGVPMGISLQFSGLLLPFAGCILVGLLGASSRQAVVVGRRIGCAVRRLREKVSDQGVKTTTR